MQHAVLKLEISRCRRSSPHKQDDKADNTHSQADLAYGCGQDSERVLRSHAAHGTAHQDRMSFDARSHSHYHQC